MFAKKQETCFNNNTSFMFMLKLHQNLYLTLFKENVAGSEPLLFKYVDLGKGLILQKCSIKSRGK